MDSEKILNFWDKKRILITYGKFYTEIQELEKFDFSKKITLKELILSKALIQNAYKTMKELDFKNTFNGKIIDYVCWINMVYSTLFIARNNQRESLNDVASFMIENHNEIDLGIRNFFRLFVKNFNYFFILFPQASKKERRSTFLKLMGVYFDLYFK